MHHSVANGQLCLTGRMRQGVFKLRSQRCSRCGARLRWTASEKYQPHWECGGCFVAYTVNAQGLLVRGLIPKE